MAALHREARRPRDPPADDGFEVSYVPDEGAPTLFRSGVGDSLTKSCAACICRSASSTYVLYSPDQSLPEFTHLRQHRCDARWKSSTTSMAPRPSTSHRASHLDRRVTWEVFVALPLAGRIHSSFVTAGRRPAGVVYRALQAVKSLCAPAHQFRIAAWCDVSAATVCARWPRTTSSTEIVTPATTKALRRLAIPDHPPAPIPPCLGGYGSPVLSIFSSCVA